MYASDMCSSWDCTGATIHNLQLFVVEVAIFAIFPIEKVVDFYSDFIYISLNTHDKNINIILFQYLIDSLKWYHKSFSRVQVSLGGMAWLLEIWELQSSSASES